MEPFLMALLASLGIAGAKTVGSLINKKVQKGNRQAGIAQGDTSKILFGGSPDNPSGDQSDTRQFQNYTPQQQALMDRLGQLGSAGIENSISQGFAPIEAKARKGFNETTIPGIAERFSKMGTGAQNSSAFTQQLGQAGSDLETNLAALGSQYNLKQQDLYRRLLELGLKPQFENAFIGNPPQEEGFLKSFNPSLEDISSFMNYFGKKGTPGKPEEFFDTPSAGNSFNSSLANDIYHEAGNAGKST